MLGYRRLLSVFARGVHMFLFQGVYIPDHEACFSMLGYFLTFGLQYLLFRDENRDNIGTLPILSMRNSLILKHGT